MLPDSRSVETLESVQLGIPEVDLVLKNAVEAGASLESIANGAVRLSQRFTVQEIQDRWHSLLCDKDTLGKVSVQISKIEVGQSISNHPKLDRFCSCKTLGTRSTKRKIGYSQPHYNATRKRICSEPIKFRDLNFEIPPCDFLFNKNGHVNELRPSKHLFDDYFSAEAEVYVVRDILDKLDIQGKYFPCIVEINAASTDVTCPSAFNMNNLAPDFSGVSFGEWTSSDDKLHEHVDGGIINLLEEKDIDENADDSYEKQTTGNVPYMLQEGVKPFQDFSDLDSPLAIGNDLKNSHLPINYLVNEHINSFSNLEERKEIKSKSLDFSNSVHQVEYSRLPELRMQVTFVGVSSPVLSTVGTVGGFKLKHSDLSAPALPFENMEKYKLENGNNTMLVTSLMVDQQEDLMSIPLKFTNEGELTFSDTDGKDLMSGSCEKNTHDFLIDSPTYLHADNTENSGEVKAKVRDTYTLSDNAIFQRELSCANTIKPLDDSACCILNMEDPEIPCNDDIFPILMDAKMCSYEDAKHSLVEIHLDNGNETLTNVVIENQETNMHHPEASSEIMEQGLKKDGGFKQEMEISSFTQTSIPSRTQLDFSDMELLDPLLATSFQKENFFDSDDDAPSFPDIEALILEMELGLDEQEVPIYTGEVSRHQNKDTGKSIRLEQSVLSYMQRAIRSNGALAVFCGRHLKHYIKKSKVVVGRTTSDSEVDIDLTKEAQTNKISRQQAIIELEEDGSFSIMNVGKSSLVVNGKEVARGNSIMLSSRCLIKIRNMVFTFEVNTCSVRTYLSTVSKKNNKATSSIFDWSQIDVT